MLVNWISRSLKIHRDEMRLVTLTAALFLCVQAGGSMGDNAASAVFLLRYGANFLPYMYVALGGLNFILALVYATGLGRIKQDRFFIGLLSGFALLILVERAALLHPFPAIYPTLWLTISGISLILGTFIWNLAGEVCDARQAKRLFPIFTSAGILGSVLGNTITGFVAGAIGTENLLIIQVGLLVCILLLTFRITRDYFKPALKAAERESLWGDLRLGFDFVRGSSLMKLIAAASILFSILYFGIAFPFNRVVSASFPDEARVAGFLGLFSGLTTAVTFFVSLFIANRLYARLGIVNSILLLPVTYIFGFGFFALNYNMVGAVTARFTQLVMLSGAADSGWNALFNVVPSQKRGQVLAFQNGVPSQIGVMLSGVLLILGEKVLTIQQIFSMCGIFALLCGLVVWRMRPAYAESLIAALRAGRVEVFSAPESVFGGIKNDRFAVSIAVQAVYDPKPTTRRLAAEILGRMNAVSAIPALIRALDDPDTGVRCAVLQALGELHARAAFDKVLLYLNDEVSEVRIASLRALPKISERADQAVLTKIESLFQDDTLNVRMVAALALAKLGSMERGISILLGQLSSSDTVHQVLALEMLGEIGRFDPPFSLDVQSVLLALNHPSALVRKAACQALGYLKGDANVPNLIKCLYDDDSTVRLAATEALRRYGPSADYGLIAVLSSGDIRAQEAALDAMVPDGSDVRDALMNYVHDESMAIRALNLQLHGLPRNGRSVKLLRETLQTRMTLHENHLLKAVGIFSDPQAMDWVRKSLQDRGSETRAAALETLETIGNKELTSEIIPLFENDGDEMADKHSLELEDVLDDLASSSEDWIRALTVRVISELGLRSFVPKLRSLESDHPSLTSETAREALIQFGEEKPMDTLQTISTLERMLLLREVPIFADLSPEDLKQIADIAHEQWLPDGDILCRAGEEGNAMYIIVSGKVRVQRGAGGNEKELAVRGEGDFVGEMAIIESAPRMATLRALGELRVLVIDSESFSAILRDRPEVSISMMKTLSRRLREMV